MNRFICFLLAGSCPFFHFAGFGQDLPDWGPVFPQDEISRLEVFIDEDSLAFLLHPDSAWSDHEYPATVVFSNSLVNDTLGNTGFRLRGNTSRLAAKKSFKVSINAFEQGRHYYGLEKLNLNGQHNDVSLMRSKLCWDSYLDSGLPASRTSYCELYINGEYKGVYLNTEHIDEQFVRRWFGNGSGNLYKCLYPADLAYLGSNPDNYKIEQFGRRVYDLKTNRYRDDYSDLAELATVLNSAPDDNFVCEITGILNVDAYLKIAAWDILLGNWDGYIYNKNNYYLYKNPFTGQFEYIPYDLDNTLGIDWLGEDWAERDPYSWQHPWENRPLFERILSVNEFRAAFSHYLEQFATSHFESGEILQNANVWLDLLDQAISGDPYYPLDYGFTYEDFSASVSSAWGGHVQCGIAGYVNARLGSLNSMLEDYQTTTFPGFLRNSGPLASEQSISFQGYLPFNENTPVWLEISYDGNTWETLEMFDDGLFPDESEGDNRYAVSLFPDFSFERLRYRMRYGNGETLFPCAPGTIWLQPVNTGLVINELMSLNTGSFLDESGEPDDWFELFNAGNMAVNLFSFSASDLLGEPGRWKMPALTLDPGEFALVWADSDEDQGNLHASFALDNAGESLFLWMEQSGAYRRVDAVHYGSLPANYSYGRSSDGNPEWVVFNEPTPGSPNGMVSVEEEMHELFFAFPNPSDNGMFRLNTPASGVVYDARGGIVLRLEMDTMLDLGKVPGGLYLFRDAEGRLLRLMKK